MSGPFVAPRARSGPPSTSRPRPGSSSRRSTSPGRATRTCRGGRTGAFLIGIAAFGLVGLAYFLAQRPDRRFELDVAPRSPRAGRPCPTPPGRPDRRARAGADLTHPEGDRPTWACSTTTETARATATAGRSRAASTASRCAGCRRSSASPTSRTAASASSSSAASISGSRRPPSVNDRTISTFSRGQQPAFAGINTFLKAPYCENIRDVGNYDVAIIGAPFDMGTTYRAGCRFGPQAVRRISALYDSYNADMARRPLRGAQPLRRRRHLRHPVEPREVLRPDRPRRLVRPRAGRVPRRHRRRPLDRLSGRPRDRPAHRGQGRDHPPRPPHRHPGTRHGRADAHDAVVPCHEHPERPGRATSSRWASAAGTGRVPG